LKLLEVLLASGADINASNQDNATALTVATQRAIMQIARL
jgi:hypothetical protein